MVERSTAVEGELDARYLLLCTPGLEAARQGLQVQSSTPYIADDVADPGMNVQCMHSNSNPASAVKRWWESSVAASGFYENTRDLRASTWSGGIPGRFKDRRRSKEGRRAQDHADVAGARAGCGARAARRGRSAGGVCRGRRLLGRRDPKAAGRIPRHVQHARRQGTQLLRGSYSYPASP